MQGQTSPNDAGLTSLSARAKDTQTCIHGLLEQTLHHKEPSLSYAVLWETGVVMKGERCRGLMLKFPSPGLARVTGLWYQRRGPASHPPLPSLSPLGFSVQASPSSPLGAP